MNRTRPQVFYETINDKKQKCAGRLNHYSDNRVLVGNWFDERAREEAEKELIMQKLSRNQMGFQKLDRYISILTRPLQLTTNLDGFVHHGDIVRLKSKNPNGGQDLFLAALPLNIARDCTFDMPCLATATPDSRTVARCAFHVFRNSNKIPNHIPLMFEECVLICTVDTTGHRLLNCEPKSFDTYARKSGHEEVTWVVELSGRSLWKVLRADCHIRRRKRNDVVYIPSNTDVVIQNLATGQNLALETETTMKTVLGQEKEVAGHTYVDRHKRFTAENLWQFEAPFVTPEDYGRPIRIPPS